MKVQESKIKIKYNVLKLFKKINFIFLLACFLFTPVVEAQYQNSLNALKKAKKEIEKAEQQEKAKVNQIEKDMATDKVENEIEEDDPTQEQTKN